MATLIVALLIVVAVGGLGVALAVYVGRDAHAEGEADRAQLQLDAERTARAAEQAAAADKVARLEALVATANKEIASLEDALAHSTDPAAALARLRGVLSPAAAGGGTPAGAGASPVAAAGAASVRR